MMTDGQPGEDPSEKDDAALWSLLERAPRPGPVSPYFARRVLREVAALEAERPAAGQSDLSGRLNRWWQAWHGQTKGVFAGALAAVALLAVGSGVVPRRWYAPTGSPAPAAASIPTVPAGPDIMADGETSPAPAWTETPVAAQDVEIIADLDNLLSREEGRLWTDEDTTARF